MKREVYEAIATLTGTIIGAGVLGIPYVISQAGFLTGMLDLAILGVAVLLLYLFLGEVVLRTKGNHQLTGYAEKYLGKLGKKIVAITMIVGIYGALTAYLVGEGVVLGALFSINPFILSLIFFAIASLVVLAGLNWIKSSELFLGGLVILIILATVVLSFSKIDVANLMSFDLMKSFVPYGVILFSLAGAVAIPEMKEVLSKNRKEIKKAIIIGALIPMVLYALFSLVVIGISNSGVTEVATVGLGLILGPHMIILGNLFAVLAMATSFLTLGLALKEMYHYDYKINRSLAWVLTCLPPLLIFLFLKSGFVKILGFTGGVAMGVEAIMIVLMYNHAKKLGDRKPEYSLKIPKFVSLLLIILFGFGIIYQFFF